MSFSGIERLRPGVVHPAPPPFYARPRETPLNLAHDATFDAWLACPNDQTLAEFAFYEWTNAPSCPAPQPPTPVRRLTAL